MDAAWTPLAGGEYEITSEDRACSERRCRSLGINRQACPSLLHVGFAATVWGGTLIRLPPHHRARAFMVVVLL